LNLPDNYHDNLKNYLQITGQLDAEGNKVSANADTSGRYHSSWLNMMYPRLKLARNLLDSDGVICVSISDHEAKNLDSLMHEIFGEDNYINTVSVMAKVSAGASGGGEDKKLKKNIEYIYIYAKDASKFNTLSHMYTERPLMDVVEEMKDAGESWKYTSILKSKGERVKIGTVPDGDGNPIDIYKIAKVERTTINKVCREEGIGEQEAYNKNFSGIFSDTNAQTSIRQRVIDHVGELNDGEMLEVEYVPRSGKEKGQLVTHSYISRTVRRVIWLKDVAEVRNNDVIKKEKVGTFWDNFDYNNLGREDGIPYPNGKKPTDLLKICLQLYNQNDFIALDFFAGSATLAAAVQKLNAKDNGKRKFILAQLPEPIDLKNKDNKAVIEILNERNLPLRLSELSKLRLKNLKETYINQDIGFRVFKLDKTNIYQWEPDFDNLSDILENSVNSIKPERTNEDVLYEILLKYGLDLTYPITEHTLAGKTVYDVAFGSLIVCLEDGITRETVEEIGKLKQELDSETTRVVFKDAGFADDAVKVNAIQLLKQYGVDDVKSI
jgi:adenine-specific DNA-methyltransferase